LSLSLLCVCLTLKPWHALVRARCIGCTTSPRATTRSRSSTDSCRCTRPRPPSPAPPKSSPPVKLTTGLLSLLSPAARALSH
jgi:hypothetical protein